MVQGEFAVMRTNTGATELTSHVVKERFLTDDEILEHIVVRPRFSPFVSLPLSPR